jgi:peptidoglycan LD-endopeptidase CwlK
MSSRDVNHLHPALLPIYREWLIRCHAENLAVKVICTWRSAMEQNAAKAKGFSNASAGQSPHNCVDTNGNPASKAFDFAVFDENARYVTDGKDARYTRAGAIAKELGLVWGGDFKSIFDPSHIELKNWKTYAG